MDAFAWGIWGLPYGLTDHNWLPVKEVSFFCLFMTHSHSLHQIVGVPSGYSSHLSFKFSLELKKRDVTKISTTTSFHYLFNNFHNTNWTSEENWSDSFTSHPWFRWNAPKVYSNIPNLIFTWILKGITCVLWSQQWSCIQFGRWDSDHSIDSVPWSNLAATVLGNIGLNSDTNSTRISKARHLVLWMTQNWMVPFWFHWLLSKVTLCNRLNEQFSNDHLETDYIVKLYDIVVIYTLRNLLKKDWNQQKAHGISLCLALCDIKFG